MTAIPQVIAAMFIGICYYMLAVAMTVYDGIISMIFQPMVDSFHPVLAIAGWLLTLFAVLHFYPSLPWFKFSKQ